MVILGIDPGTAITGYGLIDNQKDGIRIIDYGCITTLAKSPTHQRLETISNELTRIIKKHKPKTIAVENLFFCKNIKTAIAVSQARGVILLTSAKFKLNIYEYTPLEVKQTITGYGRADKNQIQQMIKRILNLDEIPKPDDAADALAIAVCSVYYNNNLKR